MSIKNKNKIQILNKVKSLLTVNSSKKKVNGEVFTPLNIIETHLNAFPKNIWSNPNLTFLDPANGIGNYPIVVYYKLMEGLKTKIPNKTKRTNHIISNMLFMCEIDQTNINISREIFGKEANIVKCDFINESNKWKKKFNVTSFDVIIGNPPFQTTLHKNHNSYGSRGSGNELWSKFVINSLNILKPNGYLAFLHPPQWRRPERDLWNIMREKKIIYLKIFSKKMAMDIFGVLSRFDIYILQNVKSKTNKTTIIDEKGKINRINISSWPFLPNYMYKTIKKILVPKEKGLTVLFDGKNHTHNQKQKNLLSLEKKNGFKVPVVHGMTKKGIRFTYTKGVLSENNKKPKVILNFNEKLYPYNDYKGEYGMSQITFGIAIKNKNEGERFVNAFKSEVFSEIIKATKWGAF